MPLACGRRVRTAGRSKPAPVRYTPRVPALLLRSLTSLGLLLLLSSSTPRAQGAALPSTADLMAGCCGAMRWRMIGPYRGGRTKAAAGRPAPAQRLLHRRLQRRRLEDHRLRPHLEADLRRPADRLDRRASPSRRRIPTSSTSGSGEGLQRPDLSTGDGIYKSTDGGRPGRTWACATASRSRRSSSIPRDPEPALRRGARPSVRAERGAGHLPLDRRRADLRQGALSRTRTPGRIDLAFDPANPNIVYAVAVGGAAGPVGERRSGTGPGSGLFKSTDGGTTWRPLTDGPADLRGDGLGRIGIAVAPERSEAALRDRRSRRKRRALSLRRRGRDAGRGSTTDPRVDDARRRTSPRSRSTRRIRTSSSSASIVAWKSIDGGKTFTAFRGAPGGDDYHRIWINPESPTSCCSPRPGRDRSRSTAARRWSSWYNQPTAQFYHVSTDNAVPVPGVRRAAGERLGVRRQPRQRRPDHLPRVAPGRRRGVRLRRAGSAEPRHRLRRQGHALRPAHRPGAAASRPTPVRDADGYRVVRTAPVLFSPVDPHTLYFASNVALEDADGGRRWTQISPDLTRETWEVPANVGNYRTRRAAKRQRRGVIYTLAPSYRRRQPHLGRHRRRADPRDARRRARPGRT